MSTFKQFLAGKGLARSSVRSYSYSVGIFTEWLKAERITDITYSQLLNFIRARRSAGESRGLIASRLTAIRWFLRWQKHEGIRATNPAEGLYLKGRKRRLPHDLLEAEQLEQLYQKYPTETIIDQRNKTMLGLLVWQGITTGELARLEPAHLDLEKGTVRMLPTKQSNSRTLELKPFQVLELYRYQLEVRPKLLDERTTENPKLFISTGSSAKLQNTLQILSNQLKKEHSFFAGFPQIRASVIANWLKTNPLRQVQYWVGHKYVSSTERYLLGGLEGLKQSVEKFHPLR
jgi:integrase/recombinase XerD